MRTTDSQHEDKWNGAQWSGGWGKRLKSCSLITASHLKLTVKGIPEEVIHHGGILLGPEVCGWVFTSNSSSLHIRGGEAIVLQETEGIAINNHIENAVGCIIPFAKIGASCQLGDQDCLGFSQSKGLVASE